MTPTGPSGGGRRAGSTGSTGPTGPGAEQHDAFRYYRTLMAVRNLRVFILLPKSIQDEVRACLKEIP